MARKKVGRPRKVRPAKNYKPDTGIPPLTSVRTLKAERKRINALNRSRSVAMENRVAKVLHGRRIPMSGAAAAFKGDVEVLFENYPGKYIVECKLSAQLKNSHPYIPFKLAWLPKLALEASNMNAKFGILVLHFHGNTDDYVFVKLTTLVKVMTQYESPYTDIINTLLRITNTIDMRFMKKGNLRTGYELLRKDIEAAMLDASGFRGVKVLTHDDEYMIISLSAWQAFVKHM